MSDRTSLEATILDLCRRRGVGRTVCPSEAARAVDPEGWRALMPAVRGAAARLRRDGRIVVSQKGRPVDPVDARGPIRLGLPGRPT